MISGDTIAAIATAPGRGGVAVVRVSGSESFGITERLTGKREEGTGISVRKVYARPSSPFPVPSSPFPVPSYLIDECVVLSFKSPHSYTGEDVVEFQCHGGAVTPRRILEACLAAGARLARRGEFTERAFLNGKLDYSQAESVLDLVDAKTARAADAALEGLSGRRARAASALYGQALELSTRIEHALDVDEGELPAGFLSSVKSQISNLKAQLRAAISKAAEGRLLKAGALVVLAGPPNAGKSSLMNALLEENRAIVSDVPGTTRDSIEAWIDLDGWPIRLVDTAGLHEAADGIEAEGVKRAEELISKSDLVLWLSPPSSPSPLSCSPFPVPSSLLPVPSSLFPVPSSLLLHSKCDLGRGDGLNVSAKTGEGLEELKRAIVAKLAAKVEAGDEGDSPADDVAAFHEALALLEAVLETGDGRREEDLVLQANAVRSAAERLGAAVGATYSADMLDNLFSRFCVGK